MQRSVESLLESRGSVYYGLMLIEALEGGNEWRSLVNTEIPKIIQAHPSVPILRYELGRLQLKDGKTEEARRLFQEELSVDPWSFKAHHGLAQIWLALGQCKEFNQELARAAAIRPEFFTPLPSLVFEIPATDLVRALENCDSSLAHQFLAAQLGRANSLDVELVPYKQKLAASDQDPLKSAEALFREKRYEAVISRLEKHTTDKSSDPSQQLLLGQAFYETGKLESAAKTAEDLSRKPEVQEAANYLQSRSYQMLAVQSLAELDRIAPDSYRAHQLRGEAYFIRKNMPEAISAFKRAIDREPGDAELFYQLGRAHYYLGEFSQAFEALEKSLRLDPYNAEANFIMGEGRVHTQEGEKAIPFLQRALELDPTMLKARGELGKAFLQMNQWQSAAKELELASRVDEGGEYHYQLFRAYSKLNQNEKAQRALVQSNKLRQEKIARERAKIASHEQSLQ
jgi:tetratricopeptide (TPR) repeat protein